MAGLLISSADQRGTMRDETLGPDHFERLYRHAADPWHFATSPYERRKYAATLSALPRSRYAKALDVGCSIGVLTTALAPLCDDLLAIEPVETALIEARSRCADQPWVRFERMFVPGQWPGESFDLVVISEVIDYLGAADLAGLAERLRTSLALGGDLLLVHWVGKKGPLPGPDEATDALIRECADFLVTNGATRNADYRLDLLRRC